MPYPCVVCNQEVRPRQHALECEQCFQWQHRGCNTGLSLQVYRQIMKDEIEIVFHCNNCTELPDHDIPAPDPEAEPAPEEPEANPEADLDAEPANENIPDQSFNITAEFEAEEPIVESDIEDPLPPDILVADGPVTYEIVERGSKQRFKKLVSSDGFAYTVKRSSATVTHWRCSVRSKSLWCKATTVQRGNQFIPGPNPHVHPSDPGLTKKTKIRAEALTEASQHPYKSAGDIVGDAMEIVSDDDFNLPNPAYVERSVNRLRQRLRPEEPKDLTFEINTDFLQCDDFVVGDVTVNDKRHIMFATQEQLQLLKQAKRWYMDGTFRVVKKPFTQLFSIHAFIQK